MPRILLVEDTPILVGLLNEVLTRQGHEVSCAKSLAEAHEAMSWASRPDLVILDDFLLSTAAPGVGTRFLRFLAGLPLILLVASGAPSAGVRRRNRRSPLAVLPKPFNLMRLSRSIQAVLASADESEQLVPSAGETVGGMGLEN